MPTAEETTSYAMPAFKVDGIALALVDEEMAHGPRAGITRHFYANGALKAKGATRDGELHGKWAWYRKDGSLIRTGAFKAGQRTGTWQTFDGKERLVKETKF